MKEQQDETSGKPVIEGQPVHPVQKKRTFFMSPAAWFAAGGIALFIGIVGFVGGMQVGRLSNTIARNTTTRSMLGAGGGYGSGGGTFNGPTATATAGLSASGAITAVSTTSVTVKDTRTGASVTFGITSSTSVTNAGATAAVSDLQVGNTVRVQSASTTSTDATLVELNPVTRGGRGMMGAY
jgi:hypothetical protein